MAVNIFSLMGSIMVDSDAADKSIQKTSDKVKGLASTLGNGIKAAGKFAAGLTTAVAGAATATGAAMYSIATDTAAVADNIDKMSQKIGVTRETYQELDFVCSQSGASVDSLKAGMKTLTATMDKTALGTSKTKTALEELGISATNSDGSLRDNETVMWECFDALQGLENQTEKERLATELFGKAGTDLMPMLNGAAGSIDNMRQQAHDLGLVIGDEVVDNGVALTDTIDQLKRGFSAMKTNIGGALLPLIQKVADKLLNYMPKIQKFIENIIPVVEELAENIIDPIMEMMDDIFPDLLMFIGTLIDPLSDIIKSILPVIIELFKKILPVIAELIQKLLPPLVDILGKLTPVFDLLLTLLDPILDVVMALIDPICDVLDAIKPVIDIIMNMINDALEPLSGKLDGVSGVLTDVLGGALGVVCDLLANTVIPAFTALTSFLNGDFLGGIDSWGTAFTGVFDTVFNTIDGIFGTHLSEWYDECKSFFMDVGSNIYEMTHQDEIQLQELRTKYTDLNYDIQQEMLKQIKSGETAADALENAKSKYLTTSEAVYYFNQDLANTVNTDFAQDLYDRWNNSSYAYTPGGAPSYVPHLATGGMAYGDTLAVIGDNPDARSNPEIVAPLGDLTTIITTALSRVMNDAVDALAAKITAANGKAAQPLNISVRLADDTELTRALIKNINDCTRQDGVCVIRGI